MHIALISARGGSTRIPNKNIYPFFGHPMIAYAIAAAKHSNLFEHVIVSTDSPLIGKIAEWYGAEYLPRPDELALDEASFPDVAIHTLDSLGEESEKVETLCQLMPNCPLRRASDITEHHQAFQEKKRDFQISVVSYRGVYPNWALIVNEDGEGSWLYGKENLKLSQSLPASVCPTGAIWCVRMPAFREQKAFYGDPFHLELMDPNRGFDIDVKEELELAEVIVSGLEARNGESPLEPIDEVPYPEEYA